MPHILDALPSPIIIAHRGASHYAPENTLTAFQLAVEQGADGIELDVRLSADGHLVVIHDATVSHSTNGQGWVANLTLARLRELDVSDHPLKGVGRTVPRQQIPTLDEVFETLGNQLLINVELKPVVQQIKILTEKVARAVQRHRLQDVVICSSFSPFALKTLEQFAPEIPRGLLIPAGAIPSRLAAFAGRKLNYQTLHPDYRDLLNGALSTFFQQSARQRVFAYTVNGETDIRRLFQMGVDGIFTDDPPLALHIRDS
ncbi:MAG TPA: glycerophosphodiester phosphodiesterase family protein [Anaerolineales bacterium]|nr:glycerophosphodiester phosphodiesterase family protein [Anaerolineales bacterium]